MSLKNKYANRSNSSEVKFRELVKLSALNLEVTQIAELTGLNRDTIIGKIRQTDIFARFGGEEFV